MSWVVFALLGGVRGGWERPGLAGRRQVPRAGEEHGSPGRRYGSGISAAGKGPLAGVGRGASCWEGAEECHPEPRDSPPPTPHSWEGKGPHLYPLRVGRDGGDPSICHPQPAPSRERRIGMGEPGPAPLEKTNWGRGGVMGGRGVVFDPWGVSHHPRIPVGQGKAGEGGFAAAPAAVVGRDGAATLSEEEV